MGRDKTMRISKKTFMSVAFVVMMLPVANLFAGNGPNDPVIKTDKSTYYVGDKINVTISNIKNNGNIKVWYCLLEGRYDACNPNKKWEMWKTSNSQQYMGPMSDAWANKWIKIIAENTAINTWSNEIYMQIKPKQTPQPGPTPPAQPTCTTETITAGDRWTNTNTSVFSDWNPNTRKVVRTIPKDTKVSVTNTKYKVSNGDVFAKISDGYINANHLNTAAPTPTYTYTTENIIAGDRWTNTNTSVFSDWNPNTRRAVRTIPTDTQVSVTNTKYKVRTGEVFAKISDGYIYANHLNTAAPASFTYESKNGVHIITLDPLYLRAAIVNSKTNAVSYSNAVNAGYFMEQANGIPFYQGILVSEGKVLSNNQPHGKPCGTLIVYNDGRVVCKPLLSINGEQNVWFAVSGCTIMPEIRMDQEGFVEKFSDIGRSCNRPVIGYNPTTKKVIIAVRGNSDIRTAAATLSNLGCTIGITLDAGGSTTLKVSNTYYFNGDGRRIPGVIYWY